MPLFEVKAGGPEIADGVYPVILSDITGPKTVTAQRGPKAGQEIDLFDWIFAIDAPGNVYDGLEISTSTSTASGPRSKMFGYLTALFGGVAPAIGAGFEKVDLCGRQALATIRKDEAGWPRIENLGAMPAAMQRAATPVAAVAAPVAAPAAASAEPVAVTVGAAQLPF